MARAHVCDKLVGQTMKHSWIHVNKSDDLHYNISYGHLVV